MEIGVVVCMALMAAGLLSMGFGLLLRETAPHDRGQASAPETSRHPRLIGAVREEGESDDARLDVVDLTVLTPDRRTLLEHVSFTVEKGAFVAVVGPTGAGKTTLLNALAGFRPADQGAVFVGGRNLYAEYDDLRRRIGYVPQDDIIHAQLTVRQALTYAAELRFPRDIPAAERSRRVDEVLLELGLAERADLVIEKLSGGQRKRVNIAVELLTKPSPLFLDEPTSGLDPGYEKGVMSLLRRLADSGRTIVIATHTVQSLGLCDRVLFLAPGGRMAFFGPPSEALAYFQRADFADVFTDLEVHRQLAWDERFRSSPEHATFVAQPMASGQAVAAPGPQLWAPARRSAGWPHQTLILLRRYLDTIVADRRNLALLLLQGPTLAVLMLATLGDHAFNAHETTAAGPRLAHTVVSVVVLTMTLTGMLNGIREIVKEAPIYRRERLVGLSIPAYVISKLAVLGPLTVAQAAIIVLVGLARHADPAKAVALGSPQLELTVDLACAGLAAMALAVMVSALMRSSDKAISVLVLLVVAQLIAAMPILDIAHKPILGQISSLSSARWAVDAVASTVDMNTVQPLGSPSTHPEWDHAVRPWLGSIGILLMLTAASIAAAALLLRRRVGQAVSVQRRQPDSRTADVMVLVDCGLNTGARLRGSPVGCNPLRDTTPLLWASVTGKMSSPDDDRSVARS